MKKLMEKFVNGIDLEAFFRDNKEMIIKVAAVALAIVAAFLCLLPRVVIQNR